MNPTAAPPPVTQLVLDLGLPPPPTLDNFVPGANAECVQRLRALAAGDRSQRFLYLWGPRGSGRSHLLAALADAAEAAGATVRRLGPQSPLSAFAPPATFSRRDTPALDALVPALTVVDDVHALDAVRQQATFHLFVAAQQDLRAAFAVAGGAAPMSLAVREDLRSRLGGSLVLRLEPPSDDDKRAALLAAARERGVTIVPEVVDYMLIHLPRDLRALMSTLDALDRFALEQKRAITLPLLREFLALPPGAAGRGVESRAI